MSASYSAKSIACDSSALISLAETSLLEALSGLKPLLGGEFLITESVKAECIDVPLRMKSHTLTAIRLQLALKEGTLNVAGNGDLERTTQDLIWTANNIFFADNKPISLFHKGEAETLALAISLNLENILMDERNARLMVEDTEVLKCHLEDEFGIRLLTNEKYLARFRQLTEKLHIFRSSELLAVAYERGHLKQFNGLAREAIEAAIYGVKFAGCSISFDEIGEYTKTL